MKKQILLAIDGSSYSNLALEYVSKLFGHQDDINFHLFHSTPSSNQVISSIEDANNSLLPTGENNNAQSCSDSSTLGKALDKLNLLGIEKDRITCSSDSAGNIAQGIIREAEKRVVDAIIVSRRGLGVVGEMFLGSVSSSLFKKCRSIPLWIIDGKIESPHFLVAVDGSPNSLIAVDHLAYILAGRKDTHLYLYHCHRFFSDEVVCKLEPFYENWDKEWVDANLAGKNCLFEGPARVLLEAGIPSGQLTILPETSNFEESTSILSQARKHNCGTIVMGRKKAGMARGIFGGVAARTMLQTQDMAIWLTG